VSERLFSRRMQLVLALLLLTLALCIARLAWLQLWRYPKYAAEALSTLTNEELVPAPRGRILDSVGAVLAEDTPSFDISVRVRELQLKEVVLKDVQAYHENRRKVTAPYFRAVRSREELLAAADAEIARLASEGPQAQEARLQAVQDKAKTLAAADVEIARLTPECQAAQAEFNRQREGAVARLAASDPLVIELAALSGASRETLARGLMNALEHVVKNNEGQPPPNATNVERRAWDRLYLRQHSALASGAQPFPGVGLTNGVLRKYPQGTAACHVLGYVGWMDQVLYEGLAAGPAEGRPEKPEEFETLKRQLGALGLAPPQPEGLAFLGPLGRTGPGRFFFKTSEGERTWLRPRGGQKIGRALPDERIGAYGVEKAHNQELRGEHAYRVWIREVEGGGWSGGLPVKKPVRDAPPKPGADLKLTLDLTVQRAAEKALAETGRNGAAVFLDATTGAVLALASAPPFDPNAFAARRNEEINRLFEDRRHPMVCRAYQSAYPPGSTFKPIMSSGALEEGVIGPGTSFTCSQVLHVGDHDFECLGTHGTIEFYTGMRKSCNIYFYHVGLKSGGERIARWARNLGYGEPSGIDLPSEAVGLMPSPAWMRQKKLGSWTDGYSCNAAIGQGYILVSPLQAAVAMAAIGNGGKVVRPHLVAEPDEKKYVRRELKFSAKTLEVMHKALAQVVNEGGTGRLAQLKTVQVAGKTGSAEHPPKGSLTHGWFIGFAPAEDPTVAFAVVLESAGHGGSVAAPVARKVLETLFGPDESVVAPTGEERD